MLLNSLHFSKYFACRRFTITAARSAAALIKDKPNVNIGTIGHVDHGKTTLTAAITKYLSTKGKTKFVKFDEIDRAKEEKRRGITINIAHIGYETPARRYAHTDCPGHRDFVKNMICGAAQMDFAVLVIAATDGAMVQTREHLLLARQIGLKDIIVFINKADCVEMDDLDLVEIEARELLTEYGYDGEKAVVIKGSALRALESDDTRCLEELLSAMDATPLPERIEDGPFIMPISSALQVPGRGTVIIGTVESGTVKKSDILELKGFDAKIKTTVTDIQVFNESVKQVSAGEHCGLLCKKLSVDAIKRGMWAGTPGVIQTTNVFGIQLYLLDQSEGGGTRGIRTGFTDHIFSSTWDQVGRIHVDNDDELVMPGEHVSGHLVFMRDVPTRKNMTFTLRRGREETIARGVISQLYKPKFVDSFRKFDIKKFVADAVPLTDETEKKIS